LRIQELNKLEAEKSVNESDFTAKNLSTSGFFWTIGCKNK
jgi:hypothetical protein